MLYQSKKPSKHDYRHIEKKIQFQHVLVMIFRICAEMFKIFVQKTPQISFYINRENIGESTF